MQDDLRVAHNLVCGFLLLADARELGEVEPSFQEKDMLNLYIQLHVLLCSFFLVRVATMLFH